jgi:hypothetical protein
MWGLTVDHGIPEPSEKADNGQCCTRNPKRANVLEETSGKSGMQLWTETMSEDKEDIRQDLQENHRAVARKVINWVYDWARENEWLGIVYESATTQVKEGAIYSMTAGDVGAPNTLGKFVPHKKRKGKSYTWTTWYFVRDLLGISRP